MNPWPLLLEPEQLAADIENDALIVVDLSHPDNYLRGHIPGAIHVMPFETQLGEPPAPGKLPQRERLEQLAGKIGLAPGKHVVVCDDEGGGWAGRFIWLLDSIGHTSYSLLNGGLIAWVHEGHPTVSGPSHTASESPRAVDIVESVSVEIDTLLSLVAARSVVIWDARSADEYHSGHIPGAVHFEWTQAMDPSHNYRLKPLEQLRATLADLGLDGSAPIVTHCQTHHRSGLTYVIGKLLGQDIKAYPGSWSEWSSRPDTPIE